MYVNDLNYEIKQRALIQNEIEASIDDWIKSNWGIEGFSRKIKEYLSLKEDDVYGALCRQIATNTMLHQERLELNQYPSLLKATHLAQ